MRGPMSQMLLTNLTIKRARVVSRVSPVAWLWRHVACAPVHEVGTGVGASVWILRVLLPHRRPNGRLPIGAIHVIFTYIYSVRRRTTD
jgi:hypothetical protein